MRGESGTASSTLAETTTALREAQSEHRTTSSATRTQRWVLGLGLLVLGWWLLQLFSSILLPFVAAGVVAYFLHPVATRMSRSIPRGLAAFLLILGLIAAVLLVMVLLYPLITQQAALLMGRVPGYIEQSRLWVNDLLDRLQRRMGPEVMDAHLRDLVGAQLGAMLSFLAGALSRIVGGGFALFNVVSLLLVTPVVAFYFLRDWPKIVARVDGWLPRRFLNTLRPQVREVDRILSAWLRGQALCCIALALFYAMTLSAAGLDLGLIVGVSSGLLSFIPYIGSIFGGVMSIGLAFAQFPDWHHVLLVAAIFVIGQVLEGWVIYPRLLGDRVELHAVWVIFALCAGGAAFGFLGVLLAVPVAAVLGVVARYWLNRYLHSPFYLDPPA